MSWEEFEKEQAKARQRESGGDKKSVPQDSAEPIEGTADTRDALAKRAHGEHPA